MFSEEQMNEYIKKMMGQFGIEGEEDEREKQEGQNPKKGFLSPAKILVIMGLASGALDVDSILVNKSQVIQIVLSGSVRQKTKMEKTMDQFGSMPFDEVMRSLLKRY